MEKPCRPAPEMVPRLQKLVRCTLPGSCWATTAAMRAGLPMVVSAIPSPDPAIGAVRAKQPCVSPASRIKNIGYTASTASEATDHSCQSLVGDEYYFNSAHVKDVLSTI